MRRILLITGLYFIVHLQFSQSSARQLPTRNVTVDWLPDFMRVEIQEEDGSRIVVRKGEKSMLLDEDYDIMEEPVERVRDKYGQYHIIQNGLMKPTLVDYLIGKFRTKSFPGKFISDTEIILNDGGQVYLQNAEKHMMAKVMGKGEDYSLEIPSQYEFVELSADRQYLMVRLASEKIWRHSSKAYYKYVRMSGKGYNLQQSQWLPNGKDIPEKIKYFSWSPVGHSLIFVDLDNNLHYQDSPEGEDLKITSDGKSDVIYNGIPDWVYEEEVFGSSGAVWWAQDGKAFVYIKFNDEEVEKMQLSTYGDVKGIGSNQYPVVETIRYPKVGTNNPKIEVWLAQITPKKKMKYEQLLPPEILSRGGQETIITTVAWVNSKKIALTWNNRIQTRSETNVCFIKRRGVKCKHVFSENESNGWVANKKITVNKNKKTYSFLMIIPEDSGLRLRKLYQYDNEMKLLTKRNAEVVKVNKWTSDDTIYYTTTGEDEPGERYLYKLNLKTCSDGCEEICLSCEDKLPDEIHRGPCLYADVLISKDGSFYIVQCMGPNVPYEFQVNTKTGEIEMLNAQEDTEEYQKKMQKPKVEYLKLPLKDTPVKAQVKIQFPPEVETAKKNEKFAMLVYVYGGPGSQQVIKTWSSPKDINTYLAVTRGVVVVTMDVRGTGFSGETHRYETYRKFGSVEVEDVDDVTQQLQEMYPFLDAGRTGIWGWSYGGFFSLSSLTSSPVFQCGVSVAPVTRWDLYDTIYTERYMSSLAENADGYNSSSPIWNVEGLRNKDLLLVHGTHDDNVHIQNSFLFAKALEEANILYQKMIYVDQDHSIASYRQHLYHTIENFFMEGCFNQNYKRKHEDRGLVLTAG